jgi:hypothetical protein
VWNNGIYCRREDRYLINLYWMSNLYAEVWYDSEKNQIQGVFWNLAGFVCIPARSFVYNLYLGIPCIELYKIIL